MMAQKTISDFNKKDWEEAKLEEEYFAQFHDKVSSPRHA